MGWVPIHESGLDYSFIPNEGYSPVAEMVESTISYARDGLDSSALWVLVFTGEKPSGIRITPISYLAATGRSGAEFTPAYFTFGFGDDQTYADNEAPPYPASTLPDDVGITTWLPSPVEFESGPLDELWYQPTLVAGDGWGDRDESYTFLIEVWQGGPPPPPEPEPCEEHGRVTRAYVSGYQRDRIHRSRLLRGERRCLVANFNGAIPRCRTIARVIWRCDQNQAVYMENARIVREGREVAVDITAQIGWGARVKCEAVLDNGEVYTQLFVIRVVSPPYFMGEPTWYAPGPTELVATA